MNVEMTLGRMMTFKEIIMFRIEDKLRAIRKRRLEKRLSRLYGLMIYFQKDAEKALHGMSETAKQIMNADHELKEFDRVHNRRRAPR